MTTVCFFDNLVKVNTKLTTVFCRTKHNKTNQPALLAKIKNVIIFKNVKFKQIKIPTLATIVLIGAILRFALLVYALFAPEIIYDGDSREYLALGENLAEHGVYEAETDRTFPPDSVRPPIYPAFLALFHLLGDGTPFLALLAQTLLSLANIWLTYRLAVQFGANQNTARLAALILALDISSIIYACTIMAETLLTTLLLIFASTLHRSIKSPDFRSMLTVSVFTAGLALTKPIAQFLPLVSVLLVLVFSNTQMLKKARFAGLHILLVFLLLMPWAMRNARKYDYLGISTVQGFNLLYYNGALAKARDEGISLDTAEDLLTNELRAEVNFDKISVGEKVSTMQTLGIKTILAHFGSYTFLHIRAMLSMLIDPGRVNLARVLYRKQGGLGLLETFSTKGLAGAMAFLFQQQPAVVILFGLAFVWQMFFLIVSILGGISFYKNAEKMHFWLLLILALYFMFITGPIGAARFRVPIMPILSIFAGFGAARIREKIFA